MIIFEGHLPAKQEAEAKSRKEGNDAYVVKADIGGIRYVVIEKPEQSPTGGKIMEHYKGGLIQKKKNE